MNDSTRRNQERQTFLTLKQKPRTRLEVAELTGIRRANICWYIRDFRERDQVAVVRQGYCPISGHPAEFLTTDPDLFPDSKPSDNAGGEL